MFGNTIVNEFHIVTILSVTLFWFGSAIKLNTMIIIIVIIITIIIVYV